MIGPEIPHEWDPVTIVNTDPSDFTDVLPTVGNRVTQTESGVTTRRRAGYDLDCAELHRRTHCLAMAPGIRRSHVLCVHFRFNGVARTCAIPALTLYQWPIN